MPVSSLREITVGVADLDARVRQFTTGCELTVLGAGAMSTQTAVRLFETPRAPTVAILGRADVLASPRIRLVEAAGLPPARPDGIGSAGPLGVGFTTRGIANPYARLAASEVRFVSPPILLTPMTTANPEGAALGPQRFEAFGQAVDGDFIVLIERVNAETPYGTFRTDCSEPLHASFIVTDLDACTHFMRDVLEHEILIADNCAGSPFDALLGLPSDVHFRFAMPHHPAFPSGRTVFMEFEKKKPPMAHSPGLARGICRLRYDTTDIHATLARVPGGGGSLVRGPVGINDPVLGHGLVAVVRSPFGVVVELWQTA